MTVVDCESQTENCLEYSLGLNNASRRVPACSPIIGTEEPLMPH